MTRGHSGERRRRRRRLLGRVTRIRIVIAALLATAFALAGPSLAGGSQPRDTYETTVAADSPVAQYRFEDASESPTLADAAGSNTATNHGIAVGGVGPFGGSASGLFGGEAYASLSSDPLEGASEFTVEAWVYWSGGSSYEESIFDFGSSATDHFFLTPASSGSGHDLKLELHTSEGASAQVTAPELGEGAWHYLAATESSAGALKLYLDGAEVGHSAEAAVNPASLGSIPTAYLGKSLASAPDFDGRLSNVAFYAKALSPSTIKAHFNAGEFPVNAAAPTISGTAEDEQVLTAHAETWTGLEPIEFGYQWLRCNGAGEGCANISGASSSTYSAALADVGHRLRVHLTGANAAGSGEALSPASAFVAPTPLTELGYASEFGTKGSGDGQFNEPYAVAVGAGGAIFVLDRGNSRVEKFNEAGEYLGQFGTEGTGEGQMRSPDALAVDSKGDVWVLDSGNGRIEEFDEHGEFVRSAGEGLLGNSEGIAVDRHDRVWVAVTSAGYLAVFGEHGEHLKDVGSHGSEPGELREPAGLAVDAAGHVWVVNHPEQVDEFGEETGEYLSRFGSHGSAAGQLGGAYGIAVDGGHVFVTEFGEWEYSRVQEFGEDGSFVAQLGAPGPEANDLQLPTGLAVDQAHDLLIANAWGNRIAKWSAEAPGPPANQSPPAILGAPAVGATLGASAGAWRGSPRRSYAYQWRRCDEHGEACADIAGATGSTYSTLSTDLGSTLRVVVAATNAHGSASATSAASQPIDVPPANTSRPTISGEAHEGQELTASVGVWEGASSYFIQWERCDEHGEGCAPIEAWEEKHTATAADVGHTLRVLVYAANSAGEASASSSPTAVVTGPSAPVDLSAPTVTGSAEDGHALTATHGSWEGATPISYAYQWQLCEAGGSRCSDIEGATSPTYAIESADLEGTLRVSVTATNVIGSARVASAPSAGVTAGPPSELRAPAIEGTAQVGQALQADPGEWGGSEPQQSYQWQLCEGDGSGCGDIAGATGAEYSLTSADLGHALRLVLGASNELGSVVALSAATTPVEPGSTLFNTWAPTISGAPQVGHLLTASAGSWLGVEALGYSYQWQRCDERGEGCTNVEGATEASYEVASSDIGHVLRVLASANEEHGASAMSSVTSAPIAAAEAPLSTAAPSVAGSPLVGYSLTTTDGEWSGGTGSLSYAYQWQRCNEHGGECTPISAASASEYAPSAADAGATLRARITASDAEGHSTSATSPPILISGAALHDVTAPSLSGPHQVDRPLQASPGIWTGAGAVALGYQWERCAEAGASCADLEGAGEAEYAPSGADAGHALRVRVHASNGSESEDATSAPSAAIAADPIAPENQVPPSIEGDATVGNVLTANASKWLSSEAIEYAYQWQRCNEEGESCSNIAGATEATYTLAEADAGSTVRVLVTAHNALGSAEAISDVSEAVATPGPPANVEAPTILGTAMEGSRLAVENGKWTGSRPLHFVYRWQRCNAEGAGCADIEGATATGYTLVSGDVGSRLRVVVSAENSIGTVSVASTPTASVLSHESASGAHAVEAAEEADPSALAKAEPASVEEQTVTPAVSDPGEELHATGTLTSADISKDTPGELALSTAGGEIALAPLGTAPGASAMPTVANETAAVFAGSFPDTNTVVRPDALGATTLLQLHSAAAPTSFSWEVGLGVNQELEELPNGSVAVVEASTTSLEGPVPSEVGPASEAEPPETEEEGHAENGAEEDLESAIGGEEPLEKLSNAPQVTTPSFMPKSTEPHPQDTAAQAERDRGALTYAEGHAGGTVLMVIQAPSVLDAEGHAVPAHLSASGGTLTLSITPEGKPTYPLIATESLAAPSDQATAASAHAVRYGLSDPNAPVFESLDPLLKAGPGRLHVGIARNVIAYNTAENGSKMAQLINWLKAVGQAGLKPYLTLGTLGSSRRDFCSVPEPCHAPSVQEYEKALAALIKGLSAAQGAEIAHNTTVKAEHKGTEEQVIPSVQLWGAWNEPDLNLNKKKRRDPLYHNPHRAARFWEIAQELIHCGVCRVVAGEFAEDSEAHVKYIKEYLNYILTDHYQHAHKPRNVGFHDYRDLVHVPNSLSGYSNPAARTFVQLVKKRFGGHAHILFSEQGVEVETESGPTRLARERKTANHTQLLAAEDFAKLGGVSRDVDVVNYYLYRGPKTAPEFDSALLDGKKAPPADQRPAYCYLVLNQHGCRAGDLTNGHIADQTTTSASAVLATIEPNGLPTTYRIEWGTTPAYGSTTSTTATSETEGAQSETVGLSGLRPCTTYHYQVIAENEANEGEPSYGGDQTLTTGCETKEPSELEPPRETERTLELTVNAVGYSRPPEVYVPECEVEYDPTTGQLTLTPPLLELGEAWVLWLSLKPTSTGFTGGNALSISPPEDKIGMEPPIQAEVKGLTIRLRASEAYNVWSLGFFTKWHLTIHR